MGVLYIQFESQKELAQAIVEQQHEISLAAIEAIAATNAPAIEWIVMLCHEIGRQIIEVSVVRAGFD